MQRMGLSASELAAYHRALRTSHPIRVRVAVQNLSGDTLATITPRILSGQITVDMGAEVSRILEIEFLDPHRALNFDSDSPDDGALYADRMLRVLYSVWVEELGRYVTAIPFTGPITKFERTDDVVSVEAAGKETFALREAWRPLTIRKTTAKVDAIRTILEDRAGENRFDFPATSVNLPARAALHRHDQPWKRARRIASSMNRQLFYPGTGRATLRKWPGTPLFTFREGDFILSPTVSNTMDDFANVVEVIGGKPKGAKHRVRYVATAPAEHPLSPQKLGRNGVPSYVVHTIDNDHVRSVVEARRLAERVLRDRLRQNVEVACDVIPFPHLDDGDLVRFDMGSATITSRLRRWTLPLHVDGNPPMSVGWNRNTIIRKRRIRRA